MLIKRIELSNFLCFYKGKEDNFIDFKQGLNLVLGGNGYGKTKLYDAFYWIFKNGITNTEGNLNPTTVVKDRLISRKAIEETQIGKIECKVSLDFIHKRFDKFTEFRIVRIYCVNKNQEGNLTPDTDSKVTIYKKTDSEFFPVGNIDNELDFRNYISDNIISLDKLSHIWFQGEKGISKAIDTSSGKSLSTIVRNLSYISHWDTYNITANEASKRIERIYRKIINSDNRNKKKREELQGKLNQVSVQFEEITEEIDGIKTEIELAKNSLKKVNINIEAHSELKKLADKQRLLESRIKQLEDRERKAFEESDRSLFKSYWIIHGTTYLANKFEDLQKEYTYRKMSELQEANSAIPQIPRGNPDTIHIKKMLEEEHCYICDRPAKKGSNHYQAIERLLPENYPSVNELKDSYRNMEVFTELAKNVTRVDENKGNFQQLAEENQNELYSTTELLYEEKKHLESSKENIRFLLQDLGIASIEDMETHLRNSGIYTEDIAKFSAKLGRKEAESEELRIKIDFYRKELFKLSGDKVSPDILKYREYFEDFANAVDEGKKKEYHKLLQFLEQQANTHYRNINKSSGAYEGMIKFNKTTSEGYSARIYNNSGEDVTPNMNTSQILSMQMSILMSILSTNKRKTLSKKYPLIADAPNSAFDYKKRQALLKEIANTFEQSIMMMFEYLEDDLTRVNRYKIDKPAIEELRKNLRNLNINLNVIHLDLADGVDVKNLGTLAVNIKQIG